MKYSGQLDIFSSGSPKEPSGNFTIYRSSAGSGKTFTLVKEYLKIVLRNPDDYQHILAVTFTNKATEEMKSRIVSSLGYLSQGDRFDLRTEIENDFREDGIDLVIEKRARRALDNILHNYSRFEVSTIDHFFARLVRILARELKLPARFDIDVDNEKAIRESLERLYTQLNSNRQLLFWMEQFALNKLESDRGWKIDSNIRELGMELFKEQFHQRFADREVRIEELQDFVADLNKTRRSFIQEMREQAHRAKSLIERSDTDPGKFKRFTADYFDRVLNGQYDMTRTFAAVAKGEGKWYTQNSVYRDEIEQLLSSGLQGMASDLHRYYEATYSSYVSAVELLKNIYSYGLLDLLYTQLMQYRTDNNLMLLSDTNFILRNVISDQDTPFLFEKLGGRFNHVLIDEFQDTSNYQWKNILPLVINSISNGHRGVVVGDIKQSIYRWRGGDFNLLLKGIQEDLKDFSHQIEVKGLQRNWRSCRQIVKFNNAFFSVAQGILQSHPELPLGSSIIKEAYSDLFQEANRQKEGYVEVRFFQPDINDFGRPSRLSTAAQEYTIEVIDKVTRQGYGYGDIMILVDRWDLAAAISHRLNQANIPLVTENSLLLENSDLIRLLLNTMTWLVDPENSIARANMLYLYLVLHNQSIDNYHHLFIENSEAVEKVLPAHFLRDVNQIRLKPAYALVEELVMLFDLSDQADIYLQRFQDVCLEQSSRGNQNIQDFLAWWEDARSRRDKKKELSVILPPQTEAVQIKTIHQAKGLEADIVILPFANFDLKPLPRTTFWTDKLGNQFKEFKLLPLEFGNILLESHFDQAYRLELAEELLERLNVAYVAFTRARDQLYLMANQFNSKKYSFDDTQLNKVIYGVLDNPGFDFRGNWDPVEWSLRLGSDEPREPADLPAAPEANKMSFPRSSDYTGKVAIRMDSQRFFMLLDHEKSQKIKEGIRTHAVLERLTNREDLPQALSECVSLGILDHEDQDNIRMKIESFFQQELFADWFKPGWTVLNERSIMADGDIYRPDRVILKGDRAVIIDYKRQKKSTRHQAQLKEYGGLLSRMGARDVKMYAVYVAEEMIEEVI